MRRGSEKERPHRTGEAVEGYKRNTECTEERTELRREDALQANRKRTKNEKIKPFREARLPRPDGDDSD